MLLFLKSNLIINGVASATSGILIYIVLIYVKQNWVRTVHFLITYTLLPLIAYVITNVISNNLALSLGMIGALSIVRFRTPVRNPLELVIFFGLLTIGISFAVHIKWGLFLVGSIVIILIFTYFLSVILKKYDFFSFDLSFSDFGIDQNFIEIESNSVLTEVENSPNLIISSKTSKDDKEIYYYKLAYKKKDEIFNFKKSLENNKAIKSIEVRYSD